MKTKRFFALLLSVIMVFGILPMTVFADEESCPHANMVYSDEFGAVAASCFEPGVRGYYYCEDCGRYFDEDKENEYWEPLPAAKIPATGHFFNTDTGECDECGLANPVYTKVTSLDDVNEEDLYIIVAEADGQYFVLGGLYDRYSDEQGNIWCPDGATNAIRVTANADGSISLVNQEVLEDGSPSEFMLDVNPEQFGDMSWLGLTTVMLKLPNHCVYPFQTRYIYDNPDYDDTGYMGVSRYATEYGMWDSSEWIIDFYTTEVTDDTYRYEDEFGSKTHAQQVADGNIGNNIAEGDLLLYKASFYSVGGAMHTLRLREYNDQYYFICGEDWCLAGVGDQYYDENTNMWRQYTNDTQYAVSLYRYDVPASAHTCDFGDWIADENADTHTRTCKDPECGKKETLEHNWNDGVEIQAPACGVNGVMAYTCPTCNATKTEDIDALEHNWSAWTSIDETAHIKTCSICSSEQSGNHEWNDGVITKEPTEWETGIKTFTCTVCSYTKTESIDKPVHECTWTDWYPDGDENHKRDCMDDNCDKFETLPHEWDNGIVTKEPTEQEVGIKTFTCTVCSYTKTESIAQLEHIHNYDSWTPVDAATHSQSCSCGDTKTESHELQNEVINWETCEYPGQSREWCDICGYESYTTRPALGHTWDNGVVTAMPTTEAPGTKTYTCSVCQATKTEELPKCITEIENNTVDVVVNIPNNSAAYIPQGTVIDIVDVPTNEVPQQVLGQIELASKGSVKPLACYDLALLLEGAEIQPNGTIQITLPALQQEFDADNVMVVYIAPDGSYQECKTTVNEDGTITFETDHFSRYAVIEIQNSTPAIVWILISTISVALIAGAVVAVIFIKKKRGIA